ncbi:MAG: heavy-metal-associated domain-containing protein [Telluria sp.]
MNTLIASSKEKFTMQTAMLTIPAMQSEVLAIQVAKVIESVAGVATVHISLADTTARIGFDETLASPGQLRGAVQSAGFIVNDEPSRHSCCGGCGGQAHR